MSTAKKATTSKAGRRADDEGKPKRPCNAFCFYLREKSRAVKSINPTDNMRGLHEQWKKLTTEQKKPYNRAAVADHNRYQREKQQWESRNARVKRPCNAYMLFIKAFMSNNSGRYENVTDTVCAGADEWKRMSDRQKGPWKVLATEESKKYEMTKAKMHATKPKPSASAAKAKIVSKTSARLTKASSKKPLNANGAIAKQNVRKAASIRKPPKTIRKIKPNKTK